MNVFYGKNLSPAITRSPHPSALFLFIVWYNKFKYIHFSSFSLNPGCEYGGYSSDITRTWPINGSFTPAQQTLYDVILTLQKDLINTLLCDGGKTLNELFDTMCLKLGFYLQEIGLIPKSASDLELARAAYNFCPHHVSHYLGMDIHDTPSISRNLNLLPGMVFTVEPGKATIALH